MKFAVFGTGGIGGFFGGRLATGGEDVWFIARGQHLVAMQTRGLYVHSSEGDFVVPPGRMTDNPASVGQCDVVLFCVKSYDTEPAAKQLDPLLREDSVVISLQNGVDNEEKVRRIISRGTVYAGSANIYSTITAPGVVTEGGGPKKLVFGPFLQLQRAGQTPSLPDRISPVQHEQGKKILNALLRTGIHAEFCSDMHTELWKKLIFIGAVGGLTTLTRLTLGELLAVQETSAMLAEAMREAHRIAIAQRANIEPAFVEDIFAKLRKHENKTRSSMYYDLVHKKPLEIEALSGTVVRSGVELGIPTPLHRFIYSCLLPYHLEHTQRTLYT
jgi:2-dehydropantoate 2-reductase